MERLRSLLSLLLTILCLSYMLLGCEKGTGEFRIIGTVTDNTFSQGLQGATATLYKVPIGTSDELFVKSVVLSSNGTYEFVVPREKMERYILKVNKALYFPIEKDIYYSALSIKEPNTFNLSTNAMAWAKIHFKNLNPIPTDHFRYIKQEGLAACASCCPSTTQDFYGPLDTTFYCLNNGNTTYSLFYWEMNTSNNGQKSTFTTAFDTTLIEVIY
ncbi:MAG: hypothetical protein NWS92_03275 [Crocinitomicaceae bacterium]|nr:hypothetical protein [Crocinitomicaceae bacterium]MDP4723590.1 hypothetical protein [Crocinitomicaceae bacterium]MDP4738860.1 hypothetical protein [Crocinitomicaceae bacterium]MDP4799032.1 hypothetical protein [Crocinitomicaceae bacterium]MDP4805803.1 hypothetical protein [Crocinitomicaceae bacterium]